MSVAVHFQKETFQRAVMNANSVGGAAASIALDCYHQC